MHRNSMAPWRTVGRSHNWASSCGRIATRVAENEAEDEVLSLPGSGMRRKALRFSLKAGNGLVPHIVHLSIVYEIL